MDWTDILAPLLSVAGSALAVVLFRLIDRFIPDTTGEHPLPPQRDTDPGELTP